MKVPIEPRLLATEERVMVEKILSVDFPGSAALRRQVGLVQVVALWGADSVSVDLYVTDPSLRAPVATGVVPVTSTVFDEEGELTGEIILWTESGMLSGIEYAWYSDQPPTSTPEADQVTVAYS